MYHIVKGRKMKNRKKRAKHTFIMHSFCVLYHSVYDRVYWCIRWSVETLRKTTIFDNILILVRTLLYEFIYYEIHLFFTLNSHMLQPDLKMYSHTPCHFYKMSKSIFLRAFRFESTFLKNVICYLYHKLHLI